jgi:hypothetical protein
MTVVVESLALRVCYGVNMVRGAGCLLLAVTVASAQRLYVEATQEELARAVPDLAELQPTSDGDKLDELLRSAAKTLDTSLELFADVSAAERINEMRFDGGVVASSRVEDYRYGIKPTLDGGEQVFTEFRIDPKTGATVRPPESIQFLKLDHFMQTLSYLLPQYLSRSTFWALWEISRCSRSRRRQAKGCRAATLWLPQALHRCRDWSGSIPRTGSCGSGPI